MIITEKSHNTESVTVLGSENCQSISLQNLLSASQGFQGLRLNTVNWGIKATAVILSDYCSPHNMPFMSLCPDKAQGYKVKVQSENISASHYSSQPIMMTSWLVSGIVYELSDWRYRDWRYRDWRYRFLLGMNINIQ